MIQLLNPVFIYSSLREKAYSSGLMARVKLNVPVISVGNLQFGGSGKTPFVMNLLERLQNDHVAVVSQSYKGRLTHPECVDLTRKDFERIYGDEPSLIKKKFPAVDVWSGPVKWKTAKAAADFKKYDLIILDDGFTHHRLHRDLDILLMDGSRALDTYRLPPFGELREPLSAVLRADLVIVTKIENLSDAQSLVSQVKPWVRRLGWAQYTSEINQSREPLQNQKYFLYAGIGQFDFFVKNAVDLGYQIHGQERFSNHFEYSLEKQIEMTNKLKTLNLRALTTEKDLIKITHPDLLALTDVLKVRVNIDKDTEHWLNERLLGQISARTR